MIKKQFRSTSVSSLNPIWNFFTLEENQEVAWCGTCQRPLRFRKGLSKTSNLIQHLRIHQLKYQEFLNDKERKALGLFRASLESFDVSDVPLKTDHKDLIPAGK